ncbi:hypothetical protein FHT76_005346 [Rhizobium sp. BK176]|nr:hypothetical protein [Rhizobium sp. BK181]MBB3543363.1 hypothetical protein [Rhizobium sp. BK399]MCS3741625.1 hypothetical protein [Rhizobium sp. BK661]MCS4093652.1 hypothetical protein [Rhizobium sp. BK176]
MYEGDTRKPSRSSKQQRLEAFEETSRFARQVADEERRKREAKTERLRKARLLAKKQES